MFRVIFFLLLLFSFMAIIIAQQSPSAVSKVNQKSSSILNKLPWFIAENEKPVDPLGCQEPWSKFRYSCYFLSDYVLTIVQANQTCNRYPRESSRSMYVKHPVELLYAAHILTANGLPSLLFEIDRDLIRGKKIVNMYSTNNRSEWKELAKNTKENLNLKSNTNTSGKQITDEKNQLENFDYIYQYCQKIQWNVAHEYFTALILTVQTNSNEHVCSLSNAESSVAYYHLCQYDLDQCINNAKCGKHGKCVNSQMDFICKCSLLSDGQFCQSWSYKDIQILIGSALVIFTILFTFDRTRNSFVKLIKELIDSCRGPKKLPLSSHSSFELKSDVNDSTKPPDAQSANEFGLKSEEKSHRKRILRFLTAIFFLIFFKLPTIDPVPLIPMNNSGLSKDTVLTFGQYIRFAFLRYDLIFLFISLVLVVIFSVLNKREKRDDDDEGSAIVEPIKLLQVTDRWTTTAIVIIQMFEILKVLEETMMDIDISAQFGILVQILQRIFFIILIALRHYPTLASLHIQNIFVRLLTVLYFILSTTYQTFGESYHTHWLAILINKFSSSKQYFHTSMHYGSFIHSLIRDFIRYLLIGYICAELLMRLLYDSIYIARQKGKSIFKILHRPIEQYSKVNTQQNQTPQMSATTSGTSLETSADSSGTSGDPEVNSSSPSKKTHGIFRRRWNDVKDFLNSIYKWDKDFRYTTIVICTYTVATVFLFHLTGTMILLYRTPTNNCVRYAKQTFEFLLNIEMKENSFDIEVIIAAWSTMIIYTIQLFFSLKHFRYKMCKLYDKIKRDREFASELDSREIIQKSTQYPSYLLLYLLGGFVLCFHLILFLCLTISHLILFLCLIISTFKFRDISFSEGRIGYFTPIFLLFFLQKMIVRWLHHIFNYLNPRKANTSESDSRGVSSGRNVNFKLTAFDSILLCFKLISCSFIGIIASILRLVASFLVNIIFMPRIDYPYLIKPMQSLDSAYQSFDAFLHLEILCLPNLTWEYKSSKGVTSAPGRPVINESSGQEHPGGNTDPDQPPQGGPVGRNHETIYHRPVTTDDIELKVRLLGDPV